MISSSTTTCPMISVILSIVAQRNALSGTNAMVGKHLADVEPEPPGDERAPAESQAGPAQTGGPRC
jgi:hypothetical protein